jgi:hypothetical protein
LSLRALIQEQEMARRTRVEDFGDGLLIEAAASLALFLRIPLNPK